SRRVWLECMGVPFYVWVSEIFKVIGGLWGNVVYCAVFMGEGVLFRIGRVQVDICEFDEIREWVRVVIGEKEIAVFVKETEWV
ncbi:hypothetical protein DF186_21650, partial [Enterococcus hirae]